MKAARVAGWLLVAGFLVLLGNNVVWVVRNRQSLAPVGAGQAAPAFDLALLDGGRARSDGSVTVLDFWATWCPPCRAELPIIDRLAQRYRGEGVRVIAVNVEERDARPEVERVIHGGSFTLPVALDGGALSERYHVDSLPTVAVIDARGNIARLFVGPADEADLVAAIDGARRASR
jgi:thiol-disulfide isomerase/thioredoxin